MWYSNGKEEDRESPDDEIGLEEGGHSVDGSASDADSRQPVLSGANAPSLSPSPNEGNKKEDDEEGQECAYFGEEGIKLLQQRRPFLALRSYLKESFMYYFSKKYNRNCYSDLKMELLSGLTVSIMQVPESVAFSFVANVDPIVGLHSTFIMATVTGLIGGKPGQISGAAGAMAVVAAQITDRNGEFSEFSLAQRTQFLFTATVIAGIVQLICGFVGLARFVTMIPRTAMLGFMNGLAIIIFIAQLDSFKVDIPGTEDSDGRPEQEWVSLKDGMAWIMLFYVAMSMLIMQFLPRLTKTVPASLVSLIFCTLFEHFVNRTAIGADTVTVGERSSLTGDLPKWNTPSEGWTEMGKLLPIAISLAFIGLIESVMTLQACDSITATPASTFRSSQEVVAQGLGNLVSGLFGSMGGDAMIGQSTINIMNGAKGRISSTMSGIGILLTIVILSPVIEAIPMASLTGILFMVVINTFAWKTFYVFFRISKSDSFTIVLVTTLAVLFDLAIAIAAGVGFASLVYAWKTAKQMELVEINPDVLLKKNKERTDSRRGSYNSFTSGCSYDSVDEERRRSVISAITAYLPVEIRMNTGTAANTSQSSFDSSQEQSGQAPEVDVLKMTGGSIFHSMHPGQQELHQWNNSAPALDANRVHSCANKEEASNQIIHLRRNGRIVRVFTVEGPLFFASVFNFTDTLRRMLLPKEDAVLLFDRSVLADFSAIDAMSEYIEERKERNCEVHMHALRNKDAKRLYRAGGVGKNIAHLEPGRAESLKNETHMAKWRRVPNKLGEARQKVQRKTKKVKKGRSKEEGDLPSDNGSSRVDEISHTRSQEYSVPRPARRGENQLLKTAIANSMRPVSSATELGPRDRPTSSPLPHSEDGDSHVGIDIDGDENDYGGSIRR